MYPSQVQNPGFAPPAIWNSLGSMQQLTAPLFASWPPEPVEANCSEIQIDPAASSSWHRCVDMCWKQIWKPLPAPHGGPVQPRLQHPSRRLPQRHLKLEQSLATVHSIVQTCPNNCWLVLSNVRNRKQFIIVGRLQVHFSRSAPLPHSVNNLKPQLNESHASAAEDFQRFQTTIYSPMCATLFHPMISHVISLCPFLKFAILFS